MPEQQKTNKLIRIGTRGSNLALAQTRQVIQLIHKKDPSVKVEVIIIKTSGDAGLTFPRANILTHQYAGKGLFVKEIEEAMLAEKIDIAVHSLKDVPAILPDELQLTSYLKREEPFDVFISKKYESFSKMPKGSVVGTSSPRRASQVLMARPDLKIMELRGNVGTRLAKLNEGVCDGTILALAGLKRLDLIDKLSGLCVEKLEKFVPAIGQGAVSIETRKIDVDLNGFLRSALNHPETEKAAIAERIFLKVIGGDCHTPIAAHAVILKDGVELTGFVASPNGKKAVQRSLAGKDIEIVANKLAEKFLKLQARKIIQLPERIVLHTGLKYDKKDFPGCKILHLPLIKIEKPSDDFRSLDSAICHLNNYDWIVFTSQNAVTRFFERKNIKRFKAKIAVVGEMTAKKVVSYGFKVSLIPNKQNSEALADEFRKLNMHGKKVLFPRAKEGLDTLVIELKKQRAIVDVVEAYRIEFAKVNAKVWKNKFKKNQPSVIVFQSPSAVKAYHKFFKDSFVRSAEVVCKGETTLNEANSLFFRS